MKLLIWGDSPLASTGFGNINKLLLNQLKKLDPNLDITVLGINSQGNWYDFEKYPYKIYPTYWNGNGILDTKDIIGYTRLLAVLSGVDNQIKENFDTLLVNLDVYMFDNLINGQPFINLLKQICPHAIKKIIYCPLDADYLPKSWIENLKFFDTVVVPSNWARKVIKMYDRELFEKTTVIYHGFDTNEISSLPLEQKEQLKKGLGAEGKFVIGYVARNNWRKDIFRTIKIFSQFHSKYPDSFLYLHMKEKDEANIMTSFDIASIAQKEGLYKFRDWATPEDFDPGVGIPRDQMKYIYNALDIHLSTSMAEGFGMPLIESMLSGTLTLSPNNTTIPELMNFDKNNFEIEKQLKVGRGIVYETNQEICLMNAGGARTYKLADENSALTLLNQIYIINKNDIFKNMKIRA
ncbi:MAG: glycosyltransferase family 4 protein, partial [Rhabdochlamydiaceae bacterium]